MRIHLEHIDFIYPGTTQSGGCEIAGKSDQESGSVGFCMWLTKAKAQQLHEELGEWLADRKRMDEQTSPEKRSVSSQMCLEQIGCLGAQCHNLMPCDDHPTKTCYSCPSCEHLNQIHNCQCHQ